MSCSGRLQLDESLVSLNRWRTLDPDAEERVQATPFCDGHGVRPIERDAWHPEHKRMVRVTGFVRRR